MLTFKTRDIFNIFFHYHSSQRYLSLVFYFIPPIKPSLTFLYKCHPTLYSAAQNCMKSWFQTVVIMEGSREGSRVGCIWLSYCNNMKKNSKFCTHTKQIKGCVRYICCYSFYFTKRKPLKNDEQCFLFHVNSSFRSRGIKFFVFPSSPHFCPVGQCRRSWLKIKFIFHDVIKCLSRSFKIHIDGYLGK